MKSAFLCAAVCCGLLIAGPEAGAGTPPARGLEFAEQFALLPCLKAGVQTYQNSSTDPEEDQFNDYSHWLYTDEQGDAVLADISGPGCIYRIWSTGNDGDANLLKIYLDGEKTPRICDTLNRFHSHPPLRQNPQVGSGGDHYLAWWSYLPQPFASSCKIVRQGNLRPFYSITYHTYTDATGVRSWNSKLNTSRLEEMWNHVTTDPKSTEGNVRSGLSVSLEPGQKKTIYDQHGAGAICSLKLSNYLPVKGLRLRIYWDGALTPAVDAPVKWFFGSVDNGGDLKALGIGTVGNNGYCFFPMPFWQEARLELENQSDTPTGAMQVAVEYSPKAYAEAQSGYFHALVNEEEKPSRRYTCLKTSGTGHVIGMAKRMPKGGHACEGDEVFYIDHRQYPDIYGTGEEDYNNNAWWTNRYNTYPTHGCIGNDCYYRLHYPDVLVYNEAIDMEFETWEPFYIASIVWYYQKDTPSVVLTDTLDVRDPAAEKAHDYSVTGVEWSGVKTGTYPGKRIYSEVISDEGNAFKGHSQFRVRVLGSNRGVRLRVRAEGGEMQLAKVWVNQKPVTERLWKISKNKFTATWVDSDFEIPSKYTRGKSDLAIRIEYDRQSHKAWSEYRYQAFSYLPLNKD